MSQLDRWIRIAALVPVVVFGVATLVASGGSPCGGLFCPEAPPPPGPVAPMGVFPQRYAFGGDLLPVEVRLADAVRAGQTATFTVSTTFPAGTVGLPGGLTIPAGQSVLRFNVSTTRVGVFLDGRVDVTWTNPDSGVTSGPAPISGGQAATLMPEPTALQLSLAPNPVPGGQPLTLQVSVTPVYPVRLDILLSADSALVQVSPEMVITGNAASGSVQVATGATAAAQTVNVTARLRAQMDVESVQVTATAATVLPSIAMQPQSQTVAVGSNTTFSVVAAGSNLVYQWQKNGTPIPGETDASLNLSNVQTAHAGSYTVVVSNFVGGAAINSITSSAATLTVTTTPPPPPRGWQQVGSDVAQGNEQRMSIAVDNSVASTPTIVAATAVRAAGRVNLLVQRFDAANSSWTLVGNGPLNADTLVSAETFTPAIAIDSGGRISVAWAENGRQMRVKRWEGGVWTILADDLRVDPNASAFGTQIDAPGGNLVVAWLETTGNVQGLGRMVMKRYGPGALTWPGGTVLPAVSNVTALRLSTEAPAGNALLMFVPQDASVASFEGPLRVLRERIAGGWTDVCGALSPPASTSGVSSPNGQLGFGIGSLAFPASSPLAVFNNGQSVFALKCRPGGWTSLDGSAQGEVAAIGPGEALWGLALTPGGNALAWSRARFLTGGGTQFLTQVMVENATSTALAPTGDVFIQDSGSGFGFGLLTTLSFTAAGSPVLSGLLRRNSSVVSQVFRYLP